MSTEQEFAHKLRHHLNYAVERLDRRTADRLYEARRRALARYRETPARISLAGIGQLVMEVILPHARELVAVIALALAVGGISLWNDYQKAAELEEIDSALLADDLPLNAYLDKGFRAWLHEHASQD